MFIGVEYHKTCLRLPVPAKVLGEFVLGLCLLGCRILARIESWKAAIDRYRLMLKICEGVGFVWCVSCVCFQISSKLPTSQKLPRSQWGCCKADPHHHRCRRAVARWK